jgi:hypothetical protein
MPAVLSRPPVRPAVRLRPVPPLDPPFDDESTPMTCGNRLGYQLALDLDVSTGRARRPRPGSGSQTGPGAWPGRATLPPEALATATAEARRAATRYLNTCLEIFNGYRPISHIRSLSSPSYAAAIIEQLSAGLRRRVPRRPTGRAPEAVQVRRLRVCEPRPGVAEVAAALSCTGRTWAMAFRLERQQGNWLGTAAHVL